MSIAVVLRAKVEKSRDRAAAGLVAAADHVVFSQRIWERTLAGHRTSPAQAEFLLKNPLTGIRVPERDLGPIATASLDVSLRMAAVQQFVSVTEAFLTDVVHDWVVAYPFHFRDKVDVQTIVAAPDKLSILEVMADQYVAALAFRSPREWFKQLNGIVALGVPVDDQIDVFAELKATHDLFVHNRGIVNETYLRKAGRLARASQGQPLDLPDEYVRDAYRLCHALVTDVGTAAAARA